MSPVWQDARFELSLADLAKALPYTWLRQLQRGLTFRAGVRGGSQATLWTWPVCVWP